MRFSILLAGVIALWPMATLADDEAVAEAIIDYMDFATETAGIIMPAQMDKDVFEAASFYDVRNADEFATGHIAGAINIDWREIPGRIEEIPEAGLVIFYCNTGMRSSQATFAARLMGRENVLVIGGGLQEWDKTAAFKP